jgi:Tfp pilus assembly protein PilV
MIISKATKHDSRSGFTFVESMVAILTGAVMLTALYSSLAFGYNAVKLTREDLRATQILLQRMEILRLTSFSSIKNASFTDYFDPGAVNSGNPGTIYTISVKTNAPTTSDMPVQPVYYMNKMIKVTVKATWTNSSQIRTRTLETYASRYGIQNYVYSPK